MQAKRMVWRGRGPRRGIRFRSREIRRCSQRSARSRCSVSGGVPGGKESIRIHLNTPLNLRRCGGAERLRLCRQPLSKLLIEKRKNRKDVNNHRNHAWSGGVAAAVCGAAGAVRADAGSRGSGSGGVRGGLHIGHAHARMTARLDPHGCASVASPSRSS